MTHINDGYRPVPGEAVLSTSEINNDVLLSVENVTSPQSWNDGRSEFTAIQFSLPENVPNVNLQRAENRSPFRRAMSLASDAVQLYQPQGREIRFQPFMIMTGRNGEAVFYDTRNGGLRRHHLNYDGTSYECTEGQKAGDPGTMPIEFVAGTQVTFGWRRSLPRRERRCASNGPAQPAQELYGQVAGAVERRRTGFLRRLVGGHATRAAIPQA